MPPGRCAHSQREDSILISCVTGWGSSCFSLRSAKEGQPFLSAFVHRRVWKVRLCEVHAIPIDSLRLFSESPAILRLFGARRLSQHDIILSFPSPEEAPTLIYEGMAQMELSLAHWRAGCGHRGRLSAFFNLCPAQSCQRWSESPRLPWSTRRSWRCCRRRCARSSAKLRR
jgi:hypothetical protein